MASNMSEMSEPVFVSREARVRPDSTPDVRDHHSYASHLTVDGGDSREHVDVVSEGTDSPQSMRRRNSHSTSDEIPFDGDSESRLRLKDKKAPGFFSPRRAGALLNIFSASHRHKNSELHKIFTSLPESELLIDDYSCALQRDILIHGRLYLTQRWICFYANIFSWETLLTIPFQSVQAITKEKTALVIPNAIQISTTSDKYGFSSLGNRDMTYNIIFKCWQNVLLNQAMSPLGLVQAARKARGESTDVGSKEDLWGKAKEGDGEETFQPMSLPTHLEIGLLPPTTVSLEEAQRRAEADRRAENSSDSLASRDVNSDGFSPAHFSLPAGLGVRSGVLSEERSGAAEVDGEAPSRTATLFSDANGIQATPTSAVDYSEKVSIGGESIASSEYESVSLIEETGEIVCGCSEHLGRTIINDVYECDVETLFQLIFTDTQFIRSFFAEEKQYNIVMSDWRSNTDGSRLRDMTYTIDLNYSFGPKFCHTTENQVYSKMGQPGLKHIVDADVINHNIPYSDTFYVACRYCITRVAPKRSRLRITANIKFKKSCWGLVKHLIERNAGDGVRSHYSHMDVALKEHIATLPVKLKQSRRHSHRRSRHKRPTPSVKSKSVTPQPMGVVEEQRGSFLPQLGVLNSTPPLLERPDVTPTPVSKKESSLPRINLALTLLLGILVASNVLLYQQLTGYSTVLPTAPLIHTSDSNTRQFQHSIPGEWPSSNEEWVSLVNELVKNRDKEAIYWSKKFSAVVGELEQIEVAVKSAKNHLLDHLEKYGQDSVFHNPFPPGDKPVQKDDKHATTRVDMNNEQLTKGDNKCKTESGESKTDPMLDGRREL